MFPFVILLSNLSDRCRNRFDRRLFFREQAKRLTIGIVSGEASRPSATQKADAVVAVAQDGNQVGRWLVTAPSIWLTREPRTRLAWALKLLRSVSAREMAASLARDMLTMSVTWPSGKRTRYMPAHLVSGSTVASRRPVTRRSSRSFHFKSPRP